MSPLDPPCLAIFDHDGVLVDSLAHHQAAWVEMGRREGLPVTAEFIHRTFGRTNPDIFRELLGEAPGPGELSRLEAIKEGCYRDIARGNVALMDGVRDLLDALAASGVLLAIGSSSVLPNLELTIESCGLGGRFAAIASGEEVRRGKPDPEIFLLAASKLGVDPSRSVVFEDAPVGIRAARSAGMRAVAVTSTNTEGSLRAAGADEVYPTLAGYPVGDLLARWADGAISS